MVEVGRGGTVQARWEREVIHGSIANRLNDLHLGDASLVFGRVEIDPNTDAEPANGAGGTIGAEPEHYYVGRIAVSDERREPIVVDWRAPIAEAFYRATGREPMGLAQRRHFTTRGRQLLNIEDEYFSADAYAERLGGDGGPGGGDGGADGSQIRGQGALFAALEDSRTGQLGDIVGTIQAQQDEVIRAELPGVLIVQGGPGTGKTVVALHRAAYLLYTHRFPLEGQGVLVIGPNRLFLSYVEQVLPSLGEAGVQLAVLADLIDRVAITGPDDPETARTKGDLVMIEVLQRACAERQRPLRSDLRIGFGAQTLVFTVEQSARIVAEARRRYRTHNRARDYVARAFWDSLAASARRPVSVRQLRDGMDNDPAVREALDWMWPVLTPAQFLNDLYGAPALLHQSAHGLLGAAERARLYRPREVSADDAIWTTDDVPLLDEARAVLGPRPGKRAEDEVRTYGHIVVDEAQDLSPMALRLLRRRTLNGSMTIVGDIAQATGSWAHVDWSAILAHLPEKRPHRTVELVTGYRIPAPLMRIADRVLALAAPGLSPATAVREVGEDPVVVTVDASEHLAGIVADVAVAERDRVGSGNVAVICSAALTPVVEAEFARRGLVHGSAQRGGLKTPITIVPVRLAKGLEVNASVVVEPAQIAEEPPQGLRSLYVALTRATQRLTLVHQRPLPDYLGV